MKRFILSLFLISAVYVSAAEKPVLFYGDIQTLGGYPMVGIGARGQSGIHGFDLSMNSCGLNPPSSLAIYHAKGLYLVYPQAKGLYLGAGLGVFNEREIMNKARPAMEFSLGYQWKKVFVEMNATAPFEYTIHDRVIPGLNIGYGF